MITGVRLEIEVELWKRPPVVRGHFPDGTGFTGHFLTASRQPNNKVHADLRVWLNQTTIPTPLPGGGQFPGIRITALIPTSLAGPVLAAVDEDAWPDDTPTTRTHVIALSTNPKDIVDALRDVSRGARDVVLTAFDQLTRGITGALDSKPIDEV